MKMNIYSVKDVVSGDFGAISILPNDQLAQRNFNVLCQESKFAKDLQLFRLGFFDNETGAIESKVEFISGGPENA